MSRPVLFILMFMILVMVSFLVSQGIPRTASQRQSDVVPEKCAVEKIDPWRMYSWVSGCMEYTGLSMETCEYRATELFCKYDPIVNPKEKIDKLGKQGGPDE